MSFKKQRRGGRAAGLAFPLVITLLTAACERPAPGAPSLPASACDLNRGPCSLPTHWGPLRLELSPRPLPVLQPILIDARFDAANDAIINASLEGVEMDMGPNLVALERLDDRRLAGRLSIPICLTGRMKWRLALRIKDGRQAQTADFVFEAPLTSAADAAKHPS